MTARNQGYARNSRTYRIIFFGRGANTGENAPRHFFTRFFVPRKIMFSDFCQTRGVFFSMKFLLPPRHRSPSSPLTSPPSPPPAPPRQRHPTSQLKAPGQCQAGHLGDGRENFFQPPHHHYRVHHRLSLLAQHHLRRLQL